MFKIGLKSSAPQYMKNCGEIFKQVNRVNSFECFSGLQILIQNSESMKKIKMIDNNNYTNNCK